MDNQVTEQTIVSTNVESPALCAEDIALQKLEDQLKKYKNDEWQYLLKSMLEGQVDQILDKDNPHYEQSLAAFKSFAAGNFELKGDFSHEILADFKLLQELLNLDTSSYLYKNVTARKLKQRKVLPTCQDIKLKTLHVLEDICKAASFIDLAFQDAKKKFVLQNTLFYIDDKQYEYDELLNIFNHIFKLQDLKAKSPHYNIFLYLLLQFAQVNVFPEASVIGPRHTVRDSAGYQGESILSPGYFYCSLALPYSAAQKFERFFNALSQGSIRRADERFEGFYSFAVKTSTIAQVFFSENFQKFVKDLLQTPQIQENYVTASNDAQIPQESIVNNFIARGKKYKLSVTTSDFSEGTMCYAFGMREKFEGAMFYFSQRFEHFATHSEFYLGIPLQDAKNLVTSINIQFANSAIFVEANAIHRDRPNTKMQVIAIKRTFLVSAEFLKKWDEAFEFLANSSHELFEFFQIQSGVRKFSTTEIASKLEALATACKSDEKLSGALTQLSLFAAARKPLPELKASSFEVAKAISAHAGQLATLDEYNLFKKGKKREIKEFQDMLGVRMSSK